MNSNGQSYGVGEARPQPIASKVVHFRCDGCEACITVSHDVGRTGGAQRPKNWFLFQARGRTGTQTIQLCPDCVDGKNISFADLVRMPRESKTDEEKVLPALWEEDENGNG